MSVNVVNGRTVPVSMTEREYLFVVHTETPISDLDESITSGEPELLTWSAFEGLRIFGLSLNFLCSSRRTFSHGPDLNVRDTPTLVVFSLVQSIFPVKSKSVARVRNFHYECRESCVVPSSPVV